MIADAIHLARSLRRSPATALAAVLTLSLTLGAGASIVALVDAIVLESPPFADPDSLVTVGEIPVTSPIEAARAVSYATYASWRQRAAPLARLEAFDGTNLTLTGAGAAERIRATNVTPGFLPLLGITPALGRGFDAEDEARAVAIVSHAFWRAKFAADPAAIGRELTLGSRQHTVVGVLPEGFSFALADCDIWRPFPVTPAQAARSGYQVRVLARLGPGVSPVDLSRSLGDVSRTSVPPARVAARRVAGEITGGAVPMLRLLAAAAGLATLIAFVNLAGLLILRGADRQRELAVRTALGARPSAIVCQVLLEAQALVGMGVLGGALLAWWITPAAGRLALGQFGGLAAEPPGVSWRAIAAVSVVASALAVIAALLPAWIAARRSTVDVLRRGVTPPRREVALRRGFVVAEIALAFVLLVCMSVLGGSLHRLLERDPGFDPRGTMALQVSLPAARYPDGERVSGFYSALQRALTDRLGPQSAAIVSEIPLTGDAGRTIAALPGRGSVEAVVREASVDYFRVMRIPIAAGRGFDWQDDAAAPPRVVVSQALARRLFEGEHPVGRQVSIARTGGTAEVIGVVADVTHRALDDPPAPTMYMSALQFPSMSSIVVVRSARPGAEAVAAVRQAVARLDGDVPVYGVRTMSDVVAASPGVPVRRVLTAAFVGFAALAVVLGALGLFGVVAHDVASRRGELALRIALGADPAQLLAATLRQGTYLAAAGVTAGAVAARWAVLALGGFVVGGDRLHAAGVTLAGALLLAIGAAAVLPAARRAARTDPMIVLRGE